MRAELARLTRSRSRSLPADLLRARASPRCRVLCQLCGRDFFTLARPSRVAAVARLNMLGAGAGAASLPTPPSPRRENINIAC